MAESKKTSRPKGRKLKPKATLKELYVSFTASEKDTKRIDSLANRVGMTRSSFVNRAIMDAVAQIEAKSPPDPAGRNFVSMVRFMMNK